MSVLTYSAEAHLLPGAALTAEGLARYIASRHEIVSYPVDLTRIVQREGVRIRLAETPYHGALSQDRQGSLITISSTLPRCRRRFTLAHELGHLYINQLARDTTQPFSITPDWDEERFCDSFAACLLMPEVIVRRLGNWDLITIDQLERTALFTLGVSPSALIRRIAVLVFQSTGMLWFQEMGKPSDPRDIKLRLAWYTFFGPTHPYVPKFKSMQTEPELWAAYRQSRVSRRQVLVAQPIRHFAALREDHRIRVLAMRGGQAAVVIEPPPGSSNSRALAPTPALSPSLSPSPELAHTQTPLQLPLFSGLML